MYLCHETARCLHYGQQSQEKALHRRDQHQKNRVWEHWDKLVEGFTKRYAVYLLVYYELRDEVTETAAREKCLKKAKPGMENPVDSGKNPQVGWSI